MDKDKFYQEQLDAQRGMLSSAIDELVKKNAALEGAMTVLNKRNDELQKIAYRSFHDMKSPMVNLSGLLELVKLETDNETVVSLLDQADWMINRMDDFGLALHDYTKVIQEDYKLESIQFLEIAKNIMDTASTIKGNEKVSLELDVSEAVKEFKFDYYRLQILFRSLLSNSIHHRDVDKEICTCKISISSTESEKLKIEVSDNGMGIDKNTLPKIFDMFYRGNNSGPGPGLGLYIVNTIVREAKGEIDIQSTLGDGTKITIELPNLL